MLAPPEYVAAVAVAVVAALVKSAANGRLRAALDTYRSKQDTAEEAHAKIPEVVQRLETIDEKQDRVYEKVEDVDDRVEQVGRTVALLHSGDEKVDTEELHDRLGVDSTDDDLFLNGGP